MHLRNPIHLDEPAHIYTRQPGAAAEARLISGVQDWEGGGGGGKAPRPRVGGGREAGAGLAVLRGFVLVGTVALFLEGMDG